MVNNGFSYSEKNELSTSAFELVTLIQNFMDDYFHDEYDVIQFNVNFLESNGFVYQTKVDYMKLNRFIATAYSTIEFNDGKVIDELLSKFYKDIIFLNHFYKNFLEKTKDIHSVFKHLFLKSVEGSLGLYMRLSEKVEKISEDELKAFEEYVKEEFHNEFRNEFEIYQEKLCEIINTKTYYFDKLLWDEARKSSAIQEFFKKSKRTENELNDELSTKIFIQQYLQTIDMSHTKNVTWHHYLQNILTIME